MMMISALPLLLLLLLLLCLHTKDPFRRSHRAVTLLLMLLQIEK
jgi:hypothetical protein